MYFVIVQSLLQICRLRDPNMEGGTDPSIAGTAVEALLSFRAASGASHLGV
jgi:hypothetical protein